MLQGNEIDLILKYFKSYDLRCIKCNDLLTLDNIVRDKNNNLLKDGCFVCKTCYEKYPHCDNCCRITETLIDIEDSNEKVCSYCAMRFYVQCNECKKYYKNNMINIQFHGCYCNNCLKNIEYFKCSNCGDYYFPDRYGIDDLCITCANNRVSNCLNYTFKPMPHFYVYDPTKNEDRILYMGVELETGYAKKHKDVMSFIEQVANTFFYMKRDASIPAYGCEVVTHPADLDYHLYSKNWDRLFEKMAYYHLSSDNDKCGVHIHMNRNFFTNSDVFAIDYFINNCRDFWKKIARRESHYSAYINKSHDEWGYQTSDRHCALNLSNDHTIELRIFKGTDDIKILNAYLDITNSLAHFIHKMQKKTSIYQIENQKLIEMFHDYLMKNSLDSTKEYLKQVA